MADAARRTALGVLQRIEEDGAFANLAFGPGVRPSGLDERDRRFVTDLVYGTTRWRRACDFLVDRWCSRPPDDDMRRILRMGAYQLAYAGVAPHAAVSATVELAPPRARGFANAVLRRLAEELADGRPVPWPNEATRLSYPDWIVERLVADLGDGEAVAAMTVMNEPATATVRADGYVQDRASQWVTELVGARAGDVVVDLCAAPGGKATGLASRGATVVATDLNLARIGLVRRNALQLAVPVLVAAADATAPPVRAGIADRILVDAPCSGLGTLRRRPDARWRIEADAIERLGGLQQRLVTAAIPLVRPGGLLVYSVCTMTRRETAAIDEFLAATAPELEALEPPGAPWQPLGRGALLLPQAAGTDGMYLLRLRAPG